MRTLVGIALAALALAAALWWFASSSPDVRGARREMEKSATSSAREEPPPSTLASAPVEEEAPEAAPEERAPARATREEASSKSAELAAAHWVEGRVVLPAGTPADEELFVTAAGRNFADGKDHRVAVAPDGSFRVAFHEKARSGRFELEGRYLYLQEIVRWKSPESSGPVVLEPKLGARLAGRLVVPAGTEPGSVGGTLELHAVRKMGSSSWSDQVGRCEVRADLAFAFDALRVGPGSGQPLELDYDGARFVGNLRGLAPEAGRTLTVELALRPGIALAGVVRNAQGEPIAKASLFAHPDGSGHLWSQTDYRHATSAADGTFRLGAIEADKIELQVEHEGYEMLQRKLGPFEAGTDVPALELVLESGLSISGLVRWPDGTPAEAQLTLTPARDQREWNVPNGESDALGAFTVAGLAEGSYRVSARATRKEEVATGTGANPKTQRATWTAEVEDVSAGTRELVLTLSAGFAVDGRVVDDLGLPLADFRIAAKRVEAGQFWFGDGDLSRAFRDTNGTFRMEGFTAGDWELLALSYGHAGSGRGRVKMPADKAIVLVLPREVVVRGRVLDPSGAPAPGAQVEVNTPSFGNPMHFRDDQDGLADEQGDFELHGLAPGTVTFQASGAGFAPSEVRTLELVAGQPLVGLELALRTGGTIQGEVLGPDGAPVAGQAVMVSATGYYEQHESDAQGRFVVTGVPPGEVRLWARTSAGPNLEERVTVASGETVRVRLVPPARVVRLHGRVLAGGEPLAGASLHARAEGGGAASSRSSQAEAGEDGSFELNLPGPGRYRLSCNERSLSWSTWVDVPAVEAYAFDLSIPLGRISGRVTDTHGAALAAIEISSEPERHEHASYGTARALTDADGRYELLVPAGRLAVVAGARSMRPGVSSEYAATRVSGLVLEANGHLRGIDLRMERGGTIAGTVRNADGSPAARASLQRQEWTRFEYVGRTDEGGRFEVPGLAPGTLLLAVTSSDGATREPVRVEVVAGETARIEIELAPAVLVRLSVRQAGVPVGSEITLEDEQGRNYPVQTNAQGEAGLGPLVAGRYTVRARRDGKTIKKEFEVTDGAPGFALELAFE